VFAAWIAGPALVAPFWQLPALYASGDGEVRFRNFKYRALP